MLGVISVNMFLSVFVKSLCLPRVVMGRRPYRESKATLLPNMDEYHLAIGNHPPERD